MAMLDRVARHWGKDRQCRLMGYLCRRVVCNYGLVRKPEDQLPGLISAYVQVAGRSVGTGLQWGPGSCLRGKRGGSLEDRVVRGQGCKREGGTGEGNRKTTALRPRSRCEKGRAQEI